MAPELTVPADAAGERLDVFLAAHAGSRSAAQRLIDDGRVTVDGAARPKRHVLAGGRDGRRDAAPAGGRGGARRRAGAVPDRLRGRPPAGGRQAAGRRRPPGARAPRGRRSCRRSPGRVAGGDDPERPGVVHRLDRDTSGLLVLARDEPTHAALKAALARRELVREYLALVEGRPPARQRDDRRAARPRPARADADVVRHGRAARRRHPLRGRAGAAGGHAAARAARDGADAPDPRAPARDRPSGRRRPRVRRRRARTGWAPVPARGAARVRASGHRRAGRRALAAAAPTSPPRWRGRKAGRTPGDRERRAGPQSAGTRPSANLREPVRLHWSVRPTWGGRPSVLLPRATQPT